MLGSDYYCLPVVLRGIAVMMVRQREESSNEKIRADPT